MTHDVSMEALVLMLMGGEEAVKERLAQDAEELQQMVGQLSAKETDEAFERMKEKNFNTILKQIARHEQMPMTDYTFTFVPEMIKFRRMLDNAGIKWADVSTTGFPPITRTHFTHRGHMWSVIHGYGTYGGYFVDEEDQGLLELMSDAVNGGEPIGYLTADEAFALVTDAGEKGEYNG